MTVHKSTQPRAEGCRDAGHGGKMEVERGGLMPNTVGGEYVEQATAEVAWALAARDALVEVAGRYGTTIKYGELAELIQYRTGIETTTVLANWIGRVLGRVASMCHGQGEPSLTSLVVHSDDGFVGVGYDAALEVFGHRPARDPVERENRAAVDRLECYKRYAPDVPPDAQPKLTAVAATFRVSASRASRTHAAEHPKVCPKCHLVLPLTGVCDNCD